MTSTNRSLVGLASLALLVAPSLHATPQSYFYNGDLTPSEGAYAALFTTIGPNTEGIGYFGNTTWSSDGNVLAMNTSLTPSEGIWFGRMDGYGDPPSFSLANSADGNLVRARLALAPGSSDWSLYWFDTQSRGSILSFTDTGFKFDYINPDTLVYVSEFHPVADMTAFHTYTSYVLADQVSYFFDNTYLGGGNAPVSSFVSNFVLIGDASASDVTGFGTLLVDSLEIITAVGSDAPVIAVPEPASCTALVGTLVLAVAFSNRRRQRVVLS